MRTKEKYLDYYREAVRLGRLPNRPDGNWPNGLCDSVVGCTELFDELFGGYKSGERVAYWGYDGETQSPDAHSLTPMRQNVILLLAAANGEL